MQKAILYLTILLVGVGLMVLVSDYVEAPTDTVYKDATGYNEALSALIEAGEVPEVPSCARTVEIGREGDRIDRIEFICDSASMRDAYVAFIQEEYAWAIATPGEDRVLLSRILEE